jgi:hypothetical protein
MSVSVLYVLLFAFPLILPAGELRCCSTFMLTRFSLLCKAA